MKLLLVIFVMVEVCTFQKLMATTLDSDTAGNQMLVIDRIIIIGNKTTKPWIIHRELSMKQGDSLSRFELVNGLETSKQNLTNTSLFNAIEMHFVIVDEVKAEIYIMLQERWYLWPRPIFELAETNFNSWLENKDFSRINYGLELIKNNFRGRNERLKFVVQFGFTEMLSLSYSIPYINKKRTLGMSVFAGYGQNHEVNYLSSQNKRLFYKDVSNIQQQSFRSGINFRYRKKFYSSHVFGGDYNTVSVSDSVVSYNSDFLINKEKNMKFFSLTYRYILDKRDNKTYALTGHYFNGTLIKYGLNIYSPSVDLWWNKLEYKHYWKLSEKFYMSGLVQVHYYFNNFQPYYLRDGLGYTDKSTIRSYELYVIDAQQMGTGKLQLKYQLISPKAYEISFVPINKFRKIHYSLYLGVFGDAGYANDEQGYPLNEFANDLQFGYGISLDLATYYDLVFRAEYSMNKFGEHGLFLHFVAPI